MADAVNIATKFQTPVIILSELSLGFSKASFPRPDLSLIETFAEAFPDSPENGWPEADEITVGEGYSVTPVFPRYLRTESGVSQRSLPGMEGCE